MTLFPERAVAFAIGGFSVHWYGIMYMIAFLLGYALLTRLVKHRSIVLSEDDVSAVMTASILGVLVGGRLGYVFFYDPQYFFSNPLEIPAVWHGGMASHGGFIGVAVALSYVLSRRRIPILPFLDVIAVPVALGLALGRFGNFINLELYGTVTALPWGIEIPGVEGLRHPTQMYAMMKDLFIAAMCYFMLRRTPAFPEGYVFVHFLILYALLRFLVEFFREQTVALWHISDIVLTRGQALSIPLFIIAVLLKRWVIRKRSS